MKKNTKIKGGKRKTFSRDAQLRSIAIGIGIVLIITGILGMLQNIRSSEDWSVSDEGILSYDLPEKANHSIARTNITETGDTLKLLTFTSRDSMIHGLMRIP